MDGTGHQLLAGAGFPFDQHRGAGTSHLADQPQHLANGAAFTDDVVRSDRGGLTQIRIFDHQPLVGATQLLHQPRVLPREMERLNGASQSEPELIRVPWLGYVAVDPAVVDPPNK